MKILMLVNHLNRGGITAYALNLCKALHGQDGLQIDIASRGGELENEFLKIGIRHIKIPLKTKCEVSLKVFFSFFKLIGMVRAEVDLIHANTRVTQVLAALLSFFSGTPYISTCHGFFKKRFSRRLLPCWGQKVIAVSEQVVDHLVCDFHLDPKHVVLVYNGVDIERFASSRLRGGLQRKQEFGLDPKKKIVGHIGRLSDVKGQMYLIFAASRLLKTRKDIQFLIIGDGRQEVYLRRLINERHLENDVFLRPSVSDTAAALSVMDVFVMPSLQEGLGFSILEAQASSVAVVASRVGGIPAVVKDGQTGLLCNAKDDLCLAQAIGRLLDNGDLREFVVSRAKAQVAEKFCVKFMAQKTGGLYRSFLAHS